MITHDILTMTKPGVRLIYCQQISVPAITLFEQRVLEDSYRECRLKIQAYNPGNILNKFSEIRALDGRANSLHYKTGIAVQHHLEMLGGKIPGLFDTTGLLQLPFEEAEFKVLESDIHDAGCHRMAVCYTTPAYTLLEGIGDKWLLGTSPATEGWQDTFLLAYREGLGIKAYTPAGN